MTRPARFRRVPAFVLVAALAAPLLVSCTKTVHNLIPNVPPSVRFTLAPVKADPGDPVFYAYRVFWAGDDPDGRVDHYDYAVDPGPKDTTWVSTKLKEVTLFFTSTHTENADDPVPRATGFHVLVLRAVDDRDAMSPRVFRAFYSYTVAPFVNITSPAPNRFIPALVPPSITVNWQGSDPDGQLHTRPVQYKFRRLQFDPVADAWMVADPDSLFRREEAAGFAGWDSVSGDTTFARFTNLSPKNQYLFLLIGYDEAGAHSPVLSLDSNLLRVSVDLAATLGPRIHVFNSFLDFTYASGGYTTDPLRWIRLQAPADRSLTFNWEAFTTAGATISRYRWAVDLKDVQDETPRTDEVNDYFHWSRGGPLEQSCTLVGLTPGDHFLFIEAKDSNGFASLGVVFFKLVVPTFNHELLIVDDTRLEVDKFPNGRLDIYKDLWPSATELDTFLFARGGFPWRDTQEPASGVVSTPGVFAGYAFDTLGTRLGLEVPSNGVTLATLALYKHVVWMVDGKAATYTSQPATQPITVLRFANGPGQASALSAYVQAGGRLWLMGGGAAYASIIGFKDDTKNNGNGQPVFDNTLELVPGRLMYDGAHWQSGFSSITLITSFQRSPRADQIAAAPWTHHDHWTGGELRAPDYRKLPDVLHSRTDEDPLPPTRRASQATQYHRDTHASEYLMIPNVITEDVDPNPTAVHIQATLDTMYDVSSALLLRSPAPAMTWYHGADANRFVFTGFAPWDFRREECVAIVDFVLQDLWGLSRRSVARGTGATGAGAPAATRPGARPAPRGTPHVVGGY